MSEPILEIPLDEFERARKDPRVQALLKRADEYRLELIERGHCSQCLVVNCEHICYLKDHNAS